MNDINMVLLYFNISPENRVTNKLRKIIRTFRTDNSMTNALEQIIKKYKLAGKAVILNTIFMWYPCNLNID